MPRFAFVQTNKKILDVFFIIIVMDFCCCERSTYLSNGKNWNYRNPIHNIIYKYTNTTNKNITYYIDTSARRLFIVINYHNQPTNEYN